MQSLSYRQIVSRWVFVLLTIAAASALVHPDMVTIYKGLRANFLPGLSDESGMVAHTVCYTTLAITGAILLPGMRIWQLALLLIGHGVTTELLQQWVPGRTFDLGDMLCNVLASIAAVTVAYLLRRTRLLVNPGLV